MDVIAWLLESDPALLWQVLRDLTGAAPGTVIAERNLVATSGWGARLLALQGADGQWDGGTYWPDHDDDVGQNCHDQERADHHGVDDPGGAEQQREFRHAARFEQQESRAQEEEMQVAAFPEARQGSRLSQENFRGIQESQEHPENRKGNRAPGKVQERPAVGGEDCGSLPRFELVGDLRKFSERSGLGILSPC